MKKIFRRKNNYRFYIFIGVCVCVILALGFLASNMFKKSNGAKDSSFTEISGEMGSIIEYGDKMNIVAHYPVTGNKIIDDEIYKSVEKYIKSFRDKFTENGDAAGDLYIDYDSCIIGDKFISIAMSFEENLSLYANEVRKMENGVYDIETGKRLALSDIVEEKQVGKLIDLVESGIKENYSVNSDGLRENIEEYIKEKPYCFYFTEKNFVVAFDEYSIASGDQGMPFVSIPYDEVKGMMKSGFNLENIDNQQVVEEEETVKEGEISSQVSRNIDPDKPMVALTFDDGPHPKYTKAILEELKKNDSAATFFVLGNRAVSYSDVVQEIIKSGSEVGNHSWSHINYSKQSADTIKKDKNRTQDAIKGIAGKAPSLIRVPYGATNDTVKSSVEMPIVLWSVDTEDWKHKNPDQTFKNATNGIKDGDIILMHDIQSNTAEAVPRIIKELKSRGFQLVTVSEMAKVKGKQLESGKKYFSLSK